MATGRRTDALAELTDLAERGVPVRHADFTDRASLDEALRGADAVLLVSGSEVGQRVALHANAINAAKSSGMRHII